MSKQLLFGLLGIGIMTGLTGNVIAQDQPLTVKQAVQNALNNYGTIRAKANYVKASQANVRETKMEYLPDINLAAQESLGDAARRIRATVRDRFDRGA